LLPERMSCEPLKNAGPSTGQVVKAQNVLLDEYYDAMGYTKAGIPTIKKLEELGIEEAINDISRHL